MTNDELQALTNKVTSDDDVSDDEQVQFLEQTDNLLQDVADEQVTSDVVPDSGSTDIS